MSESRGTLPGVPSRITLRRRPPPPPAAESSARPPPPAPGLSEVEGKSWLPTSSGKPAPKADGFGNIVHKIVWGDTLSGIARTYGVSFKDIATANRISGPVYRIIAGRSLVIPHPQRLPPAATTGAARVNARPAAVPAPNRAKPTEGAVAPLPATETTPAPAVIPVETLERQAAADEATVMSEAVALPGLPASARPAAWEKLRADFAQWHASVTALSTRGDFQSAEVKEFVAKTAQASLVQTNLPAGATDVPGPEYLETARQTAARVCWTEPGQDATSLLQANPLIGVPSLLTCPTLAAAQAQGVPLTTIQVAGQRKQVRQDVAFVFVPGIVRTAHDLAQQQQAALDAGFAPVLANTGNFDDPDRNAQAVADAIRQAKALVGNPKAKVILVGYSQGATDVLDLMRDRGGLYGDLRKDVLAIHAAHSAAAGSALADLGYALGDYLLLGKAPSPQQKILLQASDKTLAKIAGLPPAAAGGINAAMVALRAELKAASAVVRAWDRVAGPTLQKLGLHALSDEALGKALLGAALAGRDLTQELQAHGGREGKDIARLLQPAWDVVLASPLRQMISKGQFKDIIQRYVDGGLDSVTTAYGQALLSDPALLKNLQGVPVLSSVGAVPMPRENQMLPPSQRPFYDYFHELGLDNDAEVALSSQQRLGELPTGMPLLPEAASHWGAEGVIVADQTAKYFASYKPTGWIRSLLTEDAALGLV
jgi:LysM repeat protein